MEKTRARERKRDRNWVRWNLKWTEKWPRISTASFLIQYRRHFFSFNLFSSVFCFGLWKIPCKYQYAFYQFLGMETGSPHYTYSDFLYICDSKYVTAFVAPWTSRTGNWTVYLVVISLVFEIFILTLSYQRISSSRTLLHTVLIYDSSLVSLWF